MPAPIAQTLCLGAKEQSHVNLATPLPRRLIVALLACVLALACYGMVGRGAEPPGGSVQSTQGDAALYRAIDDRVAAGEGYYRAAITEQRARDYPVRPFVAVRLPTRAWLVHVLGGGGTLVALALLATLSLGATILRLRPVAQSRWQWAACAMVSTLSIVPLIQPIVALWAETWAALAVALSLAIRTDDRWGASVACGLLAALFREFALAYLAAMAFAALMERRRGEAIAWIVGGLIALTVIALHAGAVAAVTQPGDPVSQGWVRAGGWRFILSMAQATTPLMLLPVVLSAAIVPVALFGWIVQADRYARRVALTLMAWIVPFLVIGRPENSYWGLMIAPLLLAGVPLAPAAIYRLLPRSRSIGATVPPLAT